MKLDGDDQIDARDIPRLLIPHNEGLADYSKGTRFSEKINYEEMPLLRVWGNRMMSWLCKIATGYWNVEDALNGFLAIKTDSLKLLPLEKISDDYFFESDMLFNLSLVRARVVEVPHRVRYHGESGSKLGIWKVIWSFPPRYINRFFKRMFGCRSRNLK